MSLKRKSERGATGNNEQGIGDMVGFEWPRGKIQKLDKNEDVVFIKLEHKAEDKAEDKAVESDRPVLQRMYETGEWSDLTLEASDGRPFKVHKSVVCPASPFFHAACTAGSEQTHKLSEHSHVVDAFLRHVYRAPAAPWTQTTFYQDAIPLPLPYSTDFISLRMTAKKYDIASMVSIVEDIFSAFMRMLTRHECAGIIVLAGYYLFNETHHFLEPMREEVVKATAALLPNIIQHDFAFARLQKNAEYLRRTLCCKEGLVLKKP